MTIPSRLLLAVIPAALLVAACSSGGPALTEDDFAEKLCGLLKDCCAKAALSTDSEGCAAAVAASALGKTFDATAADKCLSSMSAAKSDADFCRLSQQYEGCEQVFSAKVGTKAPGEECDYDHDCAPSAEGEVTCYYDSGAVKQTCMVTVPGEAGDTPCVGTKVEEVTWHSWDASNGAAPSKGYLCDQAQGSRCDSATAVCVALKAAGEDCTSSSECVESAWCDSSDDQCVARSAIGTHCFPGDDSCESTAWCDPETTECTARLADGAACTKSESCVSGLCSNEKCAASASFALQYYCGLP